MSNKGLLFIPDISGFTRFVNETEIEHSRLIIQELLETLINANAIGLEISEIEGDAILFYKFGELPNLEELYRQVERMFCAFHRNIVSYDVRKYCQCPACVTASDLTLKVITHYGEFTDYNVRTFNKLIGKDIIVAHELLKNDIENHEYWLVTQNLVPGGAPHGPAAWMRWMQGAKRTQSGEVAYHYTALAQLKEALAREPTPRADLGGLTKMVSVSKEYETDIITLFHASGDFHYRHRWREGVKQVEELNHFLPRVGMRCRCVLEGGEVITYSNSYDYASDRIEFTEAEEGRGSVTHYLLEAIEPQRSRLTIEYYQGGNALAEMIFRLTRKKTMEQDLVKSLEKLVPLVREIRIPRQVEA